MNGIRGLAAGIRAVLLLGLALAGSGCVGARGYFHDRWADARDVFTASVGTGGGVKARVGPLNAGLFMGSDRAGLRGGEVFRLRDGPLAGGDADAVLLFFFSDQFDLRYPPQSRSGNPASLRSLRMVGDALVERNKCYRCGAIPLPSPLGTFDFPSAPHYYTQIEVAVGIGGTLRLGFNPGELLDFLLGWTTFDIYGDDLETRRAREDAKKAKGPPAAPPGIPVPPAPPPKPTAGPEGVR